ncbi:MAG: response regulator transcription factor [Actinomycetaceae bacterium]|nr:response regulator transcription factor [Actinomycetaceae bacterium]
MRLLIVEDELAFREPLKFRFEADGYEVYAVEDGLAALPAFAQFQPEVVILDLMLPGLPGTEVCRKIRQQSDCGIIMVTAKDEELDKIVGLELGADDYVTKPYSYRELLARVRSVRRRVETSRQGAPALAGSAVSDTFPEGAAPGEIPASNAEANNATVSAPPVLINPVAHELYVGGKLVELPLREFNLLLYLVENAGRVLTRQQIFDVVWGYEYEGDSKTLDVHIKRLRSKIEVDPTQPQLLVTVRGVGYKFVPAPSENL